jgi:apolipoprotein N-acyltransferase
MNYPWHTRLLLALARGAALALSFPNYNFWFLSWIAVGLLILASYRARLLEAPLYGFVHCLVFYPMCLTWIDVVVHQYGNVPPLIAAGLVLLIAVLFGTLGAVFSWGVALGSKRGPAFSCALAPFLWVALEFARTHVPIIGFPWNLAGYATSGSVALLQLTTVTGIYGLSFLVAGLGALLAYAILVGRQLAWQAVIVSLAVVILDAVGGG